MSKNENNSPISFKEYEAALDLSKIPEETKWMPNKVLIVNQPSLTFPFIPSFKSSESQSVSVPLSESKK